jgi:hypothetical protein
MSHGSSKFPTWNACSAFDSGNVRRPEEVEDVREADLIAEDGTRGLHDVPGVVGDACTDLVHDNLHTSCGAVCQVWWEAMVGVVGRRIKTIANDLEDAKLDGTMPVPTQTFSRGEVRGKWK